MGATAGELSRLTVTISRETEGAVRTLLAERGGKRGDLSKFIERTLNNELLRVTIRPIQDQNAQLPGDSVQAMIDAACADVRAEFWPKQRWWPLRVILDTNILLECTDPAQQHSGVCARSVASQPL